MKITLFSLTLTGMLALTFAWQACGKDDTNPNDSGPACTLSGSDLSYDKNMKSIIDRYCISCHYSGSTVQGIVGDYTSYDGIKSRLSNGKVLDRVVVKKDMPQGGGMPQAQRDSINCWLKSDFPK